MFGRTYKSIPVSAEVVSLSQDEEMDIVLFAATRVPIWNDTFSVECRIDGHVYTLEIDDEDYDSLSKGDIITVYNRKVWNRKGKLIEDYYDFYHD